MPTLACRAALTRASRAAATSAATCSSCSASPTTTVSTSIAVRVLDLGGRLLQCGGEPLRRRAARLVQPVAQRPLLAAGQPQDASSSRRRGAGSGRAYAAPGRAPWRRPRPAPAPGCGPPARRAAARTPGRATARGRAPARPPPALRRSDRRWWRRGRPRRRSGARTPRMPTMPMTTSTPPPISRNRNHRLVPTPTAAPSGSPADAWLGPEVSRSPVRRRGAALWVTLVPDDAGAECDQRDESDQGGVESGPPTWTCSTRTPTPRASRPNTCSTLERRWPPAGAARSGRQHGPEHGIQQRAKTVCGEQDDKRDAYHDRSERSDARRCPRPPPR